MNASQFETLFVATADIAFGCVLAFVDPNALPKSLSLLANKLGRYRTRIGIAAIVVGVLVAASAFVPTS